MKLFRLLIVIITLNLLTFSQENLEYLGQIICNSNQKQAVYFSIFGKKNYSVPKTTNLATYLQYIEDNYFLAQANPGKCDENGTLTVKLEKPVDALVILKFLSDIYNYQYFYEGNYIYKTSPLMFYKKNISFENLVYLLINTIKENNEKLNVSFLKKRKIIAILTKPNQSLEGNCNKNSLNNFVYLCRKGKCNLYVISISGNNVLFKSGKNCGVSINVKCNNGEPLKKLVVDNINLVQLVKIFGKALNINFIYNEQDLTALKHSKNLHLVLTCLNRKKALNFLSKNYQLVLKPVAANTYRIFTNPADYNLVLEKVSSLESKVFYLRNIKAEEFVKFLNIYYRNKVIYSVDPTFNAVSIIASPKIIHEIENHWKKYIANRSNLEKLMTKVFYVKYGDINLLKKDMEKYLSNWGKIKVLNKANAIEITDYPTNIAMIQNVFGRFLSQKPIKIKITAKFVRINKSFARSLGLTWSFTYGSPSNAKSISSWQEEFNSTGALISNFQFLYKKFNPITLQVSAAETLSLAKTLSSPSLVLLNNQQGTISSGVQIPYQSVDENGNPKTDLVSATLSLSVKPQLLPDGKILLNLQLSKDSPDTGLSVNGQPAINTFTIQQNFIVGNGDTLVIGGVIEKTKDNGVAGVPILRSIPILGWLFKNENWDKSEDELMVFITAQIVNE